MLRLLPLLLLWAPVLLPAQEPEAKKSADYLAELQEEAVRKKYSPAAHWGTDPKTYITWSSHSNRLIPVYTFGTKNGGRGVDLTNYSGSRSLYRERLGLQVVYEELPTNTVNPKADYLDQTNLATLQRSAIAAGKKYIFLVVFDGMDWQTTQMAAIYKTRSIPYTQGRGLGLHFLDYTAGGNTQYGYMVTAARSQDAKIDVNTQRVTELTGLPGGYNVEKGGPNPWIPGNDYFYLIGKTATGQTAEHGYPDSAATATSMCCGAKTYNAAINIDWTGAQVETVAHLAQQKGYSVGVVTSVPISHATPASAYAHNVSRDDYQDLTRDLLGLPSISHPTRPLKGVDVLIGSGWGNTKPTDADQGANFVAGNRYLTDRDLATVNVANGGKYLVSQRTKGVNGTQELQAAAEKAVKEKHRLLGFYGVAKTAHLPFQTADGKYNPVRGKNEAEEYTPADLEENPLLADMTRSALTVLEANKRGFWMMVESGDVDWANHDNNLDNSIGAVFSGDAAIKVITDWVEKNSNWSESVLIVTADHGHYLHLDQPELIIPPQSAQQTVPETVGPPRPALMAHRGLSQIAPENTLAAFGAALDLRLDLELDVYLTKDNELVVIHDETVDRTTGGQGKVTEMTLAQVRALDAGKWFSPDFAGLQVPTLGQVFEFVEERQQRPTTIAINMKTISPNIETLIAREVVRHGMLDQVYCFGMNEASHARFKTANPRLPTAISTTGYREGMDLKKPQDWETAVGDRTVEVLWVNFLPTPQQIEQAHQRNKQVWLYILDNRELMQKAALSTLDGICSDYVLEIRKLQKEQSTATPASTGP